MSEFSEQVIVMDFSSENQVAYPQLKFLFHIPNGGSRDIVTASRLKRAGVKKGVPDLFLPVSNNLFSGLWIEMKDGKGKKQTKEQMEYENFLESQWYKYVVCYSGEEAIKVLKEYLDIPKTF